MREQASTRASACSGAQAPWCAPGERDVINLCANNYRVRQPPGAGGAQRAIDELRYGMASVRFICGTHATHQGSSSARPLPRSADVILFHPASTPMAAVRHAAR